MGGRNTANKCHLHVWGVLSVFRPRFLCLHCSGFRLLYREWALSCVHFPGLSNSGSGSGVLHKVSDSVGPAFCAVPRSKQLRQWGAWWTHSLQVQCSLSPPQSQPQFLGTPGPVCLVSLLGSWSLPEILPADVDHPVSQKSLIRNLMPVCNLVRDTVSGAEFAPYRLWLAPASPLPPAGDGPVCSQLALLWYCSVLCSVNGPAVP